MLTFDVMKKSIQQLVTKLCEPQAKTGSDPIEHMLLSRRNRTLFWSFLAMVICLPLLMVFNGLPFDYCCKFLMVQLANLLLFLALCRSYLWLYHGLFVAFNVISPVIFVHTAGELTYLQMGHSVIYPLFVVLVTNNIFYGGLAVTIHSLVTMFKTKYILRRNFEMMDPDVFIDQIVHNGMTLSIATFIFFSFTLHRLNKRAREVMVANRMNEETIEKQRTFLFSFSHEMRNPLNSLLGNLELTMMEKLPLKVEEMIKTAQICAEVLLQHINNILDTGKHDIGNLEIHLAQVEVHSLFQRIWSLSGELIKRKRLKGVFKINKKMPKILLLDAHRVNQVMMNLIGNAIKFTEGGSLTVTVSWYENAVVNDEIFEPLPYDDENEGIFEKNERIHLLQTRFKRSKDSHESFDSDRRDYYTLDGQKKLYHQISSLQDTKGVLKVIISDTGCGMSAESLKQLFQKFSQVSNDPNKRKIGTGLGLFITKEICTKMEAEIRVYSKPGRGTTFIICIPTMSISIKPELKVQRSRASMFEMIALENLHCLVADDSPLNVAMVCNFFDKMKIKPIHTAGDGEEALNLYKRSRQSGKMVDVVTLDINMPKMNGRTVCQRIREFEKTNRLSSTIIILISGNYEAEQIDLGSKNTEKKADYFLKKPVTFEEFSFTIFRLLDSRIQQQRSD